MKFSKLAALYKKCSRINIVEFDGSLWLGTGAAIPYVRVGEWKKALYWLFAAGLNITVTF